MQSDVCERSGALGNRCKVLKIERTMLRFHNMQISDYRYVDKIFENFRQKWCLKSNVFDEKTSVLIWELFMSTTMKASVHFGPSYNETLVARCSTIFKG